MYKIAQVVPIGASVYDAPKKFYFKLSPLYVLGKFSKSGWHRLTHLYNEGPGQWSVSSDFYSEVFISAFHIFTSNLIFYVYFFRKIKIGERRS